MFNHDDNADDILMEIMVNIAEIWCKLGASVMVYTNWRTTTNHLGKGVDTSGDTLLRDNCQLIGMPLIVLARQAQKNRD